MLTFCMSEQESSEEKERGGKLREAWALPDENDDATASVGVIVRKNVRLGGSAIRLQSRVTGNQEKGRQV